MKREDFPQRLLRLVAGTGLTRTALMKKLGLTRTHLNKIVERYNERGGLPDPETLQKFADEFGVTIDYLLHGTDSPDEPTDPRERACEAAKLLRYPQFAIAQVLSEPDLGLSEQEWFARIRAHARIGRVRQVP